MPPDSIQYSSDGDHFHFFNTVHAAIEPHKIICIICKNFQKLVLWTSVFGLSPKIIFTSIFLWVDLKVKIPRLSPQHPMSTHGGHYPENLY